MMAWRFERRNTGGAACISGIFVFGNRSFASDSVDPSFQVIPKTRADESSLAFRQLENFDGNIPSVPPGPCTSWLVLRDLFEHFGEFERLI